jgi:phosphatidylserine decarboxylase
LPAKWGIASGREKIYFNRVKHSGKAAAAGLKMVVVSAIALVVLLAVAWLAAKVAGLLLGLTGFLVVVWALFSVFTFYFFRDPDPTPPPGNKLVLAPGHGKVDTIDFTTEPDFMGGECRRISIFLSVFDVHVQNSPVTGVVSYFKHSPGQYLNAMRADCSLYNENVLLGLTALEPAGTKVGVRLIAGLIARRILPWVAQNEGVERAQRISLIQFGSRVDVYLPKDAIIKVKLGQKVAGGNDVLAELP